MNFKKMIMFLLLVAVFNVIFYILFMPYPVLTITCIFILSILLVLFFNYQVLSEDRILVNQSIKRIKYGRLKE